MDSEDSGNSDVVTEASSTASRFSKSRPSCTRSTGRKESKREKTKLKMDANFAAEGKKFVWVDKNNEESRRASLQKALAKASGSRGPDDIVVAMPAGSVDMEIEPEQAAAAIIAKAAEEQVNMMARLFNRFTTFPGDPIFPKNPSKAILEKVEEIRQRCRRPDDFCQMCGCWGNDMHFVGKDHNARAFLNGHLNMLMGPPGTALWRPANHGCKGDGTGLVTYESLVSFWGKDIETFPVKLINKIRDTGVAIKWSKNRPSKNEKRVRAGQLCWVNYQAGTGKYSDQQVIHSMDLPVAVKKDTEIWPIVVLDFEPEAQEELGRILIHGTEPDPKDTEEPQSEPPAEEPQGMDIDGVPTEMEATPGTLAIVGTDCWAVCAVQATEETPTAWPIELRSRM